MQQQFIDTAESRLNWIKALQGAWAFTGVLFLVFALGYSLIATGLAQLIFPKQANGSLVKIQGNVIGSTLVAQPFTGLQYFQGRPSTVKTDPMAMAGSNMAMSNPALQQTIVQRQQVIAARDGVAPNRIPKDLLTASGSGIDPDMSVQGAQIQAKRIAKQRRMTEQQVLHLIQQQTHQPQFQFLGPATVNVLQLNLALDDIKAE
ncbi:MAG: potassium-transporting ATPase subunit KdpC [Acinetobacter sp.]